MEFNREAAVVIEEALQCKSACPEKLLEELRHISLLQICREMKDAMCSESRIEDALRVLALAAVKRESLSEGEMLLLCTFFCDKITNDTFTRAAIGALAMFVSDLVDRGVVCSEQIVKVISDALLGPTVNTRRLPVLVRRYYFTIINYIVCEDTIGWYSAQELSMLLSAIDGESDPELVLNVFSLHKIVFANAEGDAFKMVVDDFFESIASYFPVVFSQPPGCMVSKKQLQTALRECLSMPALAEHCVPFLLGKLSSPSLSVKEDTLEVLQACAKIYPDLSLKLHVVALATHARTEVLKLAAYPPEVAANTPVVGKCTKVACRLLGILSTRGGLQPQPELLEWFGPVVEGLIAAAQPGVERHVYSAYATMLYVVLTGSWGSCLAIGGYVFPVLALSLDKEAGEQVLVLLASLCSGMIECLLQQKAEGDDQQWGERKEELRTSIGRAWPLVVEGAKAAARRYLYPDSIVEGYSMQCAAELAASVVIFASALDSGFLADDDAAVLLDGIISCACNGSNNFVAEAAAGLVCNCARADPRRVREALVRLADTTTIFSSLQTNTQSGSEATCALLARVGAVSPDAAVLVIKDILLRPTDVGMASGKSAAHISAAVQRVLRGLPKGALTKGGSDAHPSDVLTECLADVTVQSAHHFASLCLLLSISEGGGAVAIAVAEIERFTSSAPESLLPSPCEVIALASLCAQQGQGLAKEDEEGRSNEGGGMVCLSSRVVFRLAECSVTLCESVDAAWQTVGMDGLCGLSLYHGSDVTCRGAQSAQAELRVRVAIAWGASLRSETNADCNLFSTVDSVLKDVASAGEMAIVAESIVSFYPAAAAAASTNSSSGLFPVLLAHASNTDARPQDQLHLLWRWVAQLVAKESEARLQACGPQLTSALCSAAASLPFSALPISTVSALVVPVLVLWGKRRGSHELLLEAVLQPSSRDELPLLRAVLAQAATGTLQSRYDALDLLTELARAVQQHQQAGEQHVHAATAREAVLKSAQAFLGDRKRLVRAAAARCRHEWFKVK